MNHRAASHGTMRQGTVVLRTEQQSLKRYKSSSMRGQCTSVERWVETLLVQANPRQRKTTCDISLGDTSFFGAALCVLDDRLGPPAPVPYTLDLPGYDENQNSEA